MIDPLDIFVWESLHSQYDRFVNSSKFVKHGTSVLKYFSPTPKTDLDLYYLLISRLSSERETASLMTLESYTAIVYWKLYSTSPKISNDIVNDSNRQEQLRKKLIFLSKYPKTIEKNRNVIMKLVQDTLNLNLYCMKLPVCTTVLHFFYPDVVPIFDQMILRAIGYDIEVIKRNQLNQKQELYCEYLEHNWSMAEKYADKIYNFKETPIRVIEMALWINRGNK